MEFEIKPKVDTKQAEQALGRINKETAETPKNLDKTTKGTKELGKQADKTSKAFKGATAQLDKMTGGAITAFRSIVSGAKSGVAAMFTLKGAIAATGIGALVLAVGTLVGYFTNTQRGADKVNQVMKALGATVDVLIDRVSMLGEGLFKIITGDFEGGMEVLKGAFEGVTDEIINESKAALQLEKDMQKLRDREIEFIKIQAEKRAAIERARLEAEDESKTNEERAEALRESIRIQNELTDEQIEIEKERARIIRERVALGESMATDMEEQARAEARVIELEAERDRRLRSINTRLNAFINNEKDLAEAQQARAEAEERRLRESTEQIESRGMQDLDPEQDPEVIREAKKADKIFEINENLNKALNDAVDRQAKDEENIAKKKEAIKANLTEKGFKLAGELAGKNAEAQKGVAAAEATFNTYAAIAAQLKSAAASPGGAIPGYAIAQAIATGVFGFAQVAKILSTPTNSPSAPSAPSGGGVGSVPEPETTEANIPNFDFINQGVGGGQDVGLNRNVVILQEIKDREAERQAIDDIGSLA